MKVCVAILESVDNMHSIVNAQKKYGDYIDDIKKSVVGVRCNVVIFLKYLICNIRDKAYINSISIKDNYTTTERIIIAALISMFLLYICYRCGQGVSLPDCLSQVNNFLQRVTFSSGAVISASIALFYFFFRQQRNVSESYILKWDISNLKILAVIFIMIAVSTRQFLYEYDQCDWFTFIIDFIFFSELLYFIRYVFRNVCMDVLIEKSFRDSRKLLSIMTRNKNSKKSSEILLKRLIWKVEIFYQLSFFSISKNLTELYDDIYDDSRGILNLSNQVLSNVEDDNVSGYIRYYKILLKYQKKLAIMLYEAYENFEYERSVNNFIDAYPENIIKCESDILSSVLDEYFKVVWSLLLYFSERDRDKFQEIMQKIIAVSGDEKTRRHIFIIFKALLVHAIYQNDINLLTEICYLQKSYTEKMPQMQNMVDVVKIGGGNTNTKQYYEGMGLYVLYCALIKTIELGEYKLVGFLVKCIVSNYSEEIICKVYACLLKNVCDNKNSIDNIVEDELLDRDDFSKRLGVLFNINKYILVYCLKKATLLLYYQQVYRKHVKQVPMDIFAEFSQDGFDREYCEKKIDLVGKEYGMIALEYKAQYSETIFRWLYNKSEQCIKK